MANAYVTVLTNEAYLPGVWALKRGLEEAKCRVPLVVLIPENRRQSLAPVLEKWGLDVRLGSPVSVQSSEGHYWDETFFKLRAAELTEFEKIVLLDSDMLILRNLDHLFERPAMSAVAAGHHVIPEWVELNSGLLVIEPSRALYEKLESNIVPAQKRRKEMGLPTGDQDVFHQTYPDWPKQEELHLSEAYNMLRGHAGTLCRTCLENGYRDVYVVHFIGAKKPWDYTAVQYGKMLYHGVRQRNFAEWRAFLKYKSYLRGWEQ